MSTCRTSIDPRVYQISILSGLLIYGVGSLGFDIGIERIVLIVSTAWLTQWTCTRLWHLPRFDPRSALISGLSLCLLLRSNDPWLAAAAAAIAVASKFTLRLSGKHLFNPTNIALVVLIAATGQVWVSPGQWGNAAFFGFLMACLGGLVVNRSTRSDVTFAFIACYGALVVGRSLWLGEPLTIPLHRLQSGALLLFTFFMISDPKTTPDSRAGRILFAALVALGAAYVQFKLFRTNGLLWSLACCSAAVPLIDWCLPGRRYEWSSRPAQTRIGGLMKGWIRLAAALALVLGASERTFAFCGFYVAKADTRLFNKASQVVLVRDGDHTVLTMANDFRGDPKEFAIVVPVPTMIQKGQIHVGDKALVAHLDAYSAPRLVEYFDENPCELRRWATMASKADAVASPDFRQAREERLGVKIEARYTVGEYDILILSATESRGLETWLTQNGYRIPSGASSVLNSYIRQNMRFFVAKVNLQEQAKLGFSYLRPLQVAYESPKFMLPIRLGMVNADGPQELFVYALTRKGRIETTNYRTVRLPTGMDLPLFVKSEFGGFYKALFNQQVKKEDMSAVFLEYAWDMSWCDPCAADPLSNAELRSLGVGWTDDGGSAPIGSLVRPGIMLPPRPQNVFLTRLHVRYDNEHFPEDLVFQETADRTNFQGRYVMRHAWSGGETCEAAEQYRADLKRRRVDEAEALASLTGWKIEDIRRKMNLQASNGGEGVNWWQRLWQEK